MSQDSPDLEALFDQIASERAGQMAQEQAAVAAMAQDFVEPSDANGIAADGEPYDVFQRVGKLTRSLHDALRALGYDKGIENAVGSMPDARARLDYIANLTGQAAERVLAMVERGQQRQEAMQAQTAELAQRWEQIYAKQASPAEFKACADATRAFFQRAPEMCAQTHSDLTEIMMAQDFHDLTGQVTKKVAEIAQTVESQLLKLLLDATPPAQRRAVESEWLNGPVIDAKGRTDVVTDQGQVDELLASLGF